jgi:hypothetical protein
MIDLIYLAVTVVFFGLMLAYVRACEVLGRSDQTAEREP